MSEPKSKADGERPSVVARPGPLLIVVLLSCLAAGLTIYWLLRSMHI